MMKIRNLIVSVKEHTYYVYYIVDNQYNVFPGPMPWCPFKTTFSLKLKNKNKNQFFTLRVHMCVLGDFEDNYKVKKVFGIFWL